MAVRNYVILVHGTWGYRRHVPPRAPASNGERVTPGPSPPAEEEAKPDPPPWYARDSQFVSQLQSRLPGGSAEWRVTRFIWRNCDNTDADRAQAGYRLAKKIARMRLAFPDCTIHFVAHSHGGNVVLQALSSWFVQINAAADDAYKFAWKAAQNTLAAASRNQDRSKRADQAWPLRSDLHPSLASSIREAGDCARNRTLPQWWPKGKRAKRATDLQLAALLAVSKTDLVRELERAPDSCEKISRWKSFISKCKEFARTLDLSVFDASYQSINRQYRWAEKAAAVSAANPAVHGIGRLVLMGTPFFHKRWNVNRSKPAAFLARLTVVFRVAIGLALYVYVVAVLIALITSFFADGIRAWNPATWPWGVIAAAVFIGSAVLPQLIRSIREQIYYDTNIYFDRGSRSFRRIRAAINDCGRIPCLIISAGFLDEVILGLSTEPLIMGAFRPNLRRWLGLSPDLPQSAASIPGARGVDLQVSTGRFVRFLVIGPLRLAFHVPGQMVAWLWRRSFAPIVESMTANTVRSVTQILGTGFDRGELRGACIETSPEPELKDVLDEHFWDFTQHCLSVAPFRQAQREQKRLAFLLPGGKLPDDDDENRFIYRSMKAQNVADRRLLEVALVIDERVREAMGAVGLVHSAYCENELVSQTAACFLDTATCGSRQPRCTRCEELASPTVPG